VDQKMNCKGQIGAVLLCKGGIREYRVWSIEYRGMPRFGWQVARTLPQGRGSTACCPSCLSASPTANRQYLNQVGVRARTCT
jgi:hypothetical protein